MLKNGKNFNMFLKCVENLSKIYQESESSIHFKIFMLWISLQLRGERMIRIGVVGFGYWGNNIVRNFQTAADSQVFAVCDLRPENMAQAKQLYPHVKVFNNYKELIACPEIDAVAVVTPVSTHYEISKYALLQGKHIFVEKPFTGNTREAEELIELAEMKSLIIMIDHTFVFTGAVQKIRDLMNEDMIGNLHYYEATRVNLGLFRQDVNVIWDLAPHDFSIMNYLLPHKPKALAAHGMDHYGRGLCNTAYVTVYYDKMIAHFNFNWLSPVKIRSTFIGGEKRMIVWDDLKSDEKLKVYDKGVNCNKDADLFNDKDAALAYRVSYRLGDGWVPQLDPREALANEAKYFVECVNNAIKPINDGCSDLKVLKLLEATDYSIKNEGKMVIL
jgi:predicted dehydrogenase